MLFIVVQLFLKTNTYFNRLLIVVMCRMYVTSSRLAVHVDASDCHILKVS
jgi:hypothetical protein